MKRLSLALSVLILAAMACQVGTLPSVSVTPVTSQVEPAQQLLPAMGDAAQSQELLVALFQRVSPGVVAIKTIGDQAGSLGSGFVFDAQGHIVTNYHVVEGSKQVEVDFTSGFKTYGTVIGTDLDSDLAVVKVTVPAKELSPLSLGNSDALQVGQSVIAIGNPFGLDSSMTTGIISALGRTLDSIHQSPSGGYFTAGDIIQTDAAINPGNSGGALVDIHGHLMGINTAIYSRSGGSMGIGFAIPTSTARSVMDAIVRDGKVTRGWIGVEPQDLTPELAESFSIPSGTGVIITGVLQNGPAAQAGIRPGDVVTQVGDKPVSNVSQLLSAVAALAPGEPSSLEIVRKDGKQRIQITPGKRNLPRPQPNR